jgi:hypothetical protein
MAAEDRIGSFARRLRIATDAGKVQWGRSVDDSQAYVASSGSGSVRLALSDGSVVLSLLDTHGDITEGIATNPNRPGPWLDWELALIELYDSVRLAGSGASKVIDGLSREWNLPDDPTDDIPF